MATVTGLTAARMLAIEAASVVSGTIDEFGHLILTQHDGTEIDAGAIYETIISGISETDLPSEYPSGITLLSINSDNPWSSFPTGFGTVVTNKLSTDQCHQIVYNLAGGTDPLEQWSRSYKSSSGGWTPWQQICVMNQLSAASFTQATSHTAYPEGWSRLHYTDLDSGGWDFSGNHAEVVTYRNSDSDYVRQEYTRHAGGASSDPSPVQWIRTANASTGWSRWQVVGNGPRAMLSGTVTLVGSSTANNTVNTTITFPEGYFTDIPNFVVTANSTVPGNVSISGNGVSATGAKIYMKRSDSSVSTLIWWMAVQN